MKNYFNLKVLVSALIAGILFTGCFDEINKTYDGPAVVEFAQYEQPNSNNNYSSTFTFASDADGSADISLRLNLIAPQFESDTNIGFQVVQEQFDIDGELVTEATAVEGTHFELITGNNQAVFPANSSTTSINLSLIAAGLDPGESVQLILLLTESDQLAPAENYKYYRVVLQKAA
jgi:spermidine/putrescine-binding protein